jgi:hypothetical protein
MRSLLQIDGSFIKCRQISWLDGAKVDGIAGGIHRPAIRIGSAFRKTIGIDVLPPLKACPSFIVSTISLLIVSFHLSPTRELNLG